MRSSRHHPSIFQEIHAMLVSRLGALQIRCQVRRFLAQSVYGTTRWIVPGCSLPGVHARSSNTRRSLCTCLPKFGPLDGACGALGRGCLCREGCRLDLARCQACRFFTDMLGVYPLIRDSVMSRSLWASGRPWCAQGRMWVAVLRAQRIRRARRLACGRPA